MITRATLIWAVLAIAAGFGLFQVSYRVAALEEELNKVNRQIVEERERLHALQADWSYLTNPSRLADLARRHLPLQPLAAEQMIRIEDLPLRLAPLVAEGDGFQQALPASPPRLPLRARRRLLPRRPPMTRYRQRAPTCRRRPPSPLPPRRRTCPSNNPTIPSAISCRK